MYWTLELSTWMDYHSKMFSNIFSRGEALAPNCSVTKPYMADYTSLNTKFEYIYPKVGAFI